MDRSLNKLFVLPLLAALMSCEQPTDKLADARSNGEGTAATFYVDRVKPEASLFTTDTKKPWAYPDQLQFSASACLRDRVNKEPIRGLPFVVHRGEDNTSIPLEAPSDSNGCVRWVEKIPFNFFAKQSERVLLNRWVSGADASRSGRVLLQFSVNPWALGAAKRDHETAVLYLGDVAVSERDLKSVNLLTQQGVENVAELMVDEVGITSQRRKILEDGQLVDFNFEVKPRFVYYNRAGERVSALLTSGQFDVVAHLIATDAGPSQNETVILTPVEMQEISTIDNGTLRVTVRTNLERRVAIGNLALVMKLIPKNFGSLYPVQPFDGVFELGSIEASRPMTGRLAARCRKDNRVCRTETVLAQAGNFKALRQLDAAFKGDPLIFGNLRLRFVTVEPGETATQRTVIYAATTCIRDRWTGQPIVDTPFTIEYLDEKQTPLKGRTKTAKTNEEGCLAWDSKISHKYYQPEKLFWHDVRISLSSGYQRVLTFALNPWDEKFTFGWDKREFSDELIQSVQNRKKIPSRFFLSSYSYNALRFLYNIDEFMELEVKKTVLLKLNPRVLRYSGIINARQQTENLRDGIYLMKVAIQKDYLDPAAGGHRLRNQKDMIPQALIEELGGPVSRKEYISTQTHLVRVVDGLIMQPVELTMRDLRLMRVRANFMIQLETIDERLLQAEQVLNDQFKKDLTDLTAEREELNQLTPEEREARLLQRAEERKKNLEAGFFLLKEQLQNVDGKMESFDLTLESSLVDKLKLALDRNDFTTIKLTSSSESENLIEALIERDSGLEKRTFVGPVIFLSNGFSDSLRATDNLDEARCSEPDPDDLINKGLASSLENWVMGQDDSAYKLEQMKLFVDAEEQSRSQRQNNAYRYSKYYGAMKHLCYKSVDDFIQKETEAHKNFKAFMPHLASIYNFVHLNNLDYVSLTDQPVTKLNLECEATASAIEQCVDTTTESTMAAKDLMKLVQGRSAQRTLSQEQQALSSAQQIFMRETDPNHTEFLCRVLSEAFVQRLVKFDRQRRHQGHWVGHEFYQACVGGGLAVEDRLRVKKTGKYTFLGGLQINLNVGEAISLNRSESWSSSLKPLEVIEGPVSVGAILGSSAVGFALGGPVGAGAGALAGAGVAKLASEFGKLIKPVSLSKGESLGSSDGTSISQSTYIVAQIARFHLMLNRYEHCRSIRMTPSVARTFAIDQRMDSALTGVVSRGIFVCTGVDSTNPIGVEEEYYYFTQHFTEGDMLDQADMYNHPWLLALRGVRDFATFTELTNSQEVVNLHEFMGGVFNPQKRPLGWPLAHMENTYRKMMPTFPGFYTLVKGSEKLPRYPLAERLSTADEDLNNEVRCQLDEKKRCVR